MINEFLVRHRLLRKLQQRLANVHLLIIAPPGYGKTILLQQLAAYRPNSCYLPLTADYRDTAVLQSRLQSFQQPGYTLLLDDIHCLAGADTTINWLAAQLAQSDCRYVMCGRFIPEEFEIALAKGQAVRWKARDLLFAPEESQALLGAADDQAVGWSDWHAQLEGWPLGLGLLARLSGAHQTPKMARRQLFAYLAQELFDQLPADLRQFMRVTAVPLQFNDALAAHLLNQEAAALRQEIQRRNLFLYESDQPGHFRYHDLIRDYLLDSAEFEPRPYRQKTIAWHETGENLPQAVEHALEDPALHEEAARLIALVPPAYIYETDRYLTYRRWVEELAEPLRAAHPTLLFRLGHFLQFVDEPLEIARQYMRQALAAAQAQGNQLVVAQARWQLAEFSLQDKGPTDEVLAELTALAAAPETARHAARSYAQALADKGRFAQSRNAWRKAIDLALDEDNYTRAWATRRSMTLTALLPIGRLQQAGILFDEVIAYFNDDLGDLFESLSNKNEIHLASGDWSALAANQTRLAKVEERLESPAINCLTWNAYYRGLLATAEGQFTAADQQFALMSRLFDPGDHRCEIPLASARSWALRRQEKLTEAVALADAELAKPSVFTYYRALLSLERDISAGFLFLAGTRAEFTPRLETLALITMRARPDLARLRALLALVCHKWGDGRWRRHFHAALYALKLPHYERLLTDRDPELGGRFWQLAVTSGLAVGQAGAALRRLNQPELLYPLLAHGETAVRQRAARILGKMGGEAAMPHLSQAIERERDNGTKAALAAVLAHLEGQPPPFMQIQLLGDFRLTRDGRPIADSDWPRPVTRRLAQYFALHRGVPLPRDQILDDLWPDLPPDKAWANFRTVYSQLRRVVEPYMRPKADSRYFSLEGERYLFDPGNYVAVDLATFETAVRQAIAQAADTPLPPLPDDLLARLENWRPLLPELAYEEWLLAARERVETTYIEGCLYVARGQLSYGRPAEAVVWARRAIAQAPWLEEGYRALMRGYARQDKRSLALKTYEEAVRALKQELNAEPSPLTHWLFTRLQNNEEI